MIILNDILGGGLIDWQGVEMVTTKRGRIKPVLRGIPTDSFWRAWKHGKSEFRAIPGFTLSYEVESVSAARETKTGMVSSAGGYKQGTKLKKFWTCDIWINKANIENIKPIYDLPQVNDSITMHDDNDPF
jgi:hypothetical protein